MNTIVKGLNVDSFLREVRLQFQQGSIKQEPTVFTDLHKISIRSDYYHMGGAYLVNVFVKDAHAGDPEKSLVSVDFSSFKDAENKHGDISGEDVRVEDLEIVYAHKIRASLETVCGKNNVHYTPIRDL